MLVAKTVIVSISYWVIIPLKSADGSVFIDGIAEGLSYYKAIESSSEVSDIFLYWVS